MDRNKIASGLAFYRTKYIERSNIKPNINQHLKPLVNYLATLAWCTSFGSQQMNKRQNMLLVSEKIDDLNSERVLSRTNHSVTIKCL